MKRELVIALSVSFVFLFACGEKGLPDISGKFTLSQTITSNNCNDNIGTTYSGIWDLEQNGNQITVVGIESLGTIGDDSCLKLVDGSNYEGVIYDNGDFNLNRTLQLYDTCEDINYSVLYSMTATFSGDEIEGVMVANFDFSGIGSCSVEYSVRGERS